MPRTKVVKNFFQKMSFKRFCAYMDVFGEDAVMQELCKQDVKKFATIGEQHLSADFDTSNREQFDGKIYHNVAPGEVKEVTSTDEEPNAKNVASTNSLFKNPLNEFEVVAKRIDTVLKALKFDSSTQVMKTYAPKRIVIGVVYVPYDPNDESTIDTHGHAATAEDIEKTAYQFMKDLNLYNIDRQHNFLSQYGYVVESYIAKQGDPDFIPGAWVVGVKVTDNDTWSKIEKGEITGFSLAGSAILEDPK